VLPCTFCYVAGSGVDKTGRSCKREAAKKLRRAAKRSCKEGKAKRDDEDWNGMHNGLMLHL
jgi:hypothetical protein